MIQYNIILFISLSLNDAYMRKHIHEHIRWNVIIDLVNGLISSMCHAAHAIIQTTDNLYLIEY